MSIGGFYIFRIPKNEDTNETAETEIVALVLFNKENYIRIPIEKENGISEEDLVFIEKFIENAKIEDKEKERIKSRGDFENDFKTWFLREKNIETESFSEP